MPFTQATLPSGAGGHQAFSVSGPQHMLGFFVWNGLTPQFTLLIMTHLWDFSPNVPFLIDLYTQLPSGNLHHLYLDISDLLSESKCIIFFQSLHTDIFFISLKCIIINLVSQARNLHLHLWWVGTSIQGVRGIRWAPTCPPSSCFPIQALPRLLSYSTLAF